MERKRSGEIKSVDTFQELAPKIQAGDKKACCGHRVEGGKALRDNFSEGGLIGLTV